MARRDDDLEVHVETLGNRGARKDIHRQVDGGGTDRGRVVDAREGKAVLLRQLVHAVQVAPGMRRDVGAGHARADEGLDRARALQARIRPDAVDVVRAFALDDGCHDLATVGGAPAGILGIDDLDARELGEDLARGLQAHLGGAGARKTRQQDDAALTVQRLGHPGGAHPRQCGVGRGDEADEVRVGFHAPRDGDDRNALPHHAAQDRVQRVGGGGVHDQQVDILFHQVLDVGNLLGRIAVGVGHDELGNLVGVLRHAVLHRVIEGAQPAVALRGVGEADHEGAFALVLFGIDHLVEIRVPQECPRQALVAVIGHGDRRCHDHRGAQCQA